MRRLLDVLYILGALLAAPIWLTRMIRTGKINTDWPGRFGDVPVPPPADGRPRLLIHAVSVGEANAARDLVASLLRLPDPPQIIIASTTDTGFARCKEIYGPDLHVVRYPFDFSFAVRRFLDRVRPDAVALVELEVWPNFTAECHRRGIGVGVVNGRLTARSARRYNLVRALIAPAFRRLAFAAVQEPAYAERFETIGVPRDRIHVTGSMKWDTATIADSVDGAAQLAEALGIDCSRPLIVAGSTAPGEHELLVRALPDGVQLLCAPRKPEWFDQAATVLSGCARRSRQERGSTTGRFLLDTIGELRKAYALADLVIIGRTFIDLEGSDMIEPIALGKATIVGPFVQNFQASVDALLAGNGLVQCTAADLQRIITELLNDPHARAQLAQRGRDVIRQHQGATARTTELVLDLLHPSRAPFPPPFKGGAGGG